MEVPLVDFLSNLMVSLYDMNREHQWRNVVAVAIMVPLGGEMAPPSGVPDIDRFHLLRLGNIFDY